MNKLLLTSLASLITVSGLSAGEKKLPSMPRNYDYGVVENYFSAYLSGDKSPFSTGYSIKNGQVKDVESRVWQQWVNANDSFEEEKLPGA